MDAARSILQGNEQQNKAIVWNEGPALILAGPGSGKTFTTVERVRYLIEVHRVDPSQILVITFTKAAARQMRERFFKRMDGVFHPVTFGTFHAVFFQILKISCHYESNAILTEKEKREFLRIVWNNQPKRPDREEGLEEGLLSEISYLKNAGHIEEGFRSAYLEEADFRRVFLQFQTMLRDMGKLDLDDFAAAVRHLFLTNPQALSEWQRRFSYILVDEFQDINETQYEAVKLLAGEKRNLFVVGDDDQSIYGFRGSDPAIMRRFVKDFPGAAQISLSVNYRSTPGIVETAGKLIGKNQNRFPKKITAGRKAAGDGRGEVLWRPLARDGSVRIGGFPDRKQQMQEIARLIGQIYGKGDCAEEDGTLSAAAIFRTNTDGALLAEELGKEGIPFVMREKIKSPYAHQICQDLLSYLRFAKAGRAREDFYRIMNRPCRYLSRQKVTAGQVSFPALMEAYREKPYMQQLICRLRDDVSRIAGMDLYAAVNYVRKGMGYDGWMAKELTKERLQEAKEMADFFQESVREFRTVEQLEEHISQYEQELREAQAAEADVADKVMLMTMHGAKGLEFDIVFLPDCNEGVVPHKKSMRGAEVEEERRIFYVGMTRAKERLYLSWVAGTKENPGFASRFLAECGYREPYRPG